MSAAIASSRGRVFSAYRRLFRARKKLFEGDVEAMLKSRTAIREQFVQNKAAPTSGEHFEGLLTMVDEAEDMLLTGFVRGQLNESTGHYEVKVKPEHTSSGADAASIPQLEPVTEKTVQSFEKASNSGGVVEVTKCSSSSQQQQAKENKD